MCMETSHLRLFTLHEAVLALANTASGPTAISSNMSSAFDATDTRTRRFRNVGNSCYINSILQALFAVPPVQRLYESEDLNCDFSEGMRRDDGRNDGDIACATVYREARAAARRGEPMKPQIFLCLLYTSDAADE